MPPNSPSGGVPGSAGANSVRVEPSAIPGLVNALQSSLDSVGLQIEHAITELRIRPWAGDPVSAHTAEGFNRRSFGGESDALTALCGYRDQLLSAATALDEANRRYNETDSNSGRIINDGC